MPILHIVALKFKSDLTEDRLEDHFVREVNLKERMPDLVEEWHWSKNKTLETRSECNRGMQYVVHVTVKDMESLDAYLKHPQHVLSVGCVAWHAYEQEVGAIQGPMLEDKFVVDMEV